MKKNVFFFLVAAIIFLDLSAQGSTDIKPEKIDPKSFSGKTQMSGYQMEDFKGFEKDWHFVTVRFRKDTGEMRLTYANDLAWEALKKQSLDYPKGAVFAKIGIATKEDPAFISSAVPSGARRTQFMVRDKEKFAESDGWGYVLFDASGKTFPEDPAITVRACAACHRLVPDRGFVFSERLNPLGLGNMDPHVRVDHSPQLVFWDVKFKDLPKAVKSLLPVKTQMVRSLMGDLQKHLFQGTLDEVRPLLAQESKRSGKPALLMSQDGERFSVVFSNPKISCTSGQKGFTGVANIYFESKQYEVNFCH